MMEWKRWAREEILGDKIFPREAGKYRLIVNNWDDVMKYVNRSKWVDCYLSIFSNWQIRRRMFDVVFLDLDDHDGRSDRDKMLRAVVDSLGDSGVRVYDSGRGYHVFYIFPCVRLEHYSECVRRYVIECGVNEYVDMHVVGDIRRLARVPGTVNSKCGKKMRLVMDRDDVCEWWEKLVRIDRDLSKSSKKEVRTNVNCKLDVDISGLPLCMREGIEILAKTGELEHEWRLALSIFLMKLYGKDFVNNLFMLFADDYSEKITKYHLNWLEKRKYKCYSCKKMKELGICSFSDLRRCAWYKVSSGWLENVVGGDD